MNPQRGWGIFHVRSARSAKSDFISQRGPQEKEARLHRQRTDNSTVDFGQSEGGEISTSVAPLTSFQPSMGNFGRNRLTRRAPATGLHSDTRVSNTRRCPPCPPSSAPPWSPPSRPSAPCAPPAWSPPAPRPSPSPRPRYVFSPVFLSTWQLFSVEGARGVARGVASDRLGFGRRIARTDGYVISWVCTIAASRDRARDPRKRARAAPQESSVRERTVVVTRLTRELGVSRLSLPDKIFRRSRAIGAARSPHDRYRTASPATRTPMNPTNVAP